MKILALETSAKSVSAAVSEHGVILASAYQNTGLTHSRTLMPLVDGMLRAASLTLDDMGLVAVAHGPGSFTGLRIGVSAAKGLAWAKSLPCCGVSTLEAMARGVSDFDGLIVCAMDARRQQVYHALFRCENGQLTRLCDDCAISLEALSDSLRGLSQPKLVVGDGAQLCYNKYGQLPGVVRAPAALCGGRAAGVALAAQAMQAAGQAVPPAALLPSYHRLSQAERERAAREQAQA